VNFADELLLLSNEETALLGMTDCLVFVRRFYRMEMSVEKNKVMGISRSPSPIQIMIGQKRIGYCGIFQIFR